MQISNIDVTSGPLASHSNAQVLICHLTQKFKGLGCLQWKAAHISISWFVEMTLRNDVSKVGKCQEDGWRLRLVQTKRCLLNIVASLFHKTTKTNHVFFVPKCNWRWDFVHQDLMSPKGSLIASATNVKWSVGLCSL